MSPPKNSADKKYDTVAPPSTERKVVMINANPIEIYTLTFNLLLNVSVVFFMLMIKWFELFKYFDVCQ